MPEFITRTANPNTSDSPPVNRYEGFTANGEIILHDRSGTAKAGIPDDGEFDRLAGRLSLNFAPVAHGSYEAFRKPSVLAGLRTAS